MTKDSMTIARPFKGFTLIELMITVAIVAILAAIAYPNYKETVARGRRAEAKAVLLDNAQWLERQYTVSNDYQKQGDGNTAVLPTTEAPRDGSGKSYDISFSASSPTGFTLQAVPKNGMSSDKCGTLTLSNTGAKARSGTTATLDYCWGK